MSQKLWALPTVVLAGAALLAGCGGSSKTSSTAAPSSTTVPASTSSPTTTSTQAAGATSSSGSSGAAGAASTQEAAAICKSVLERATTLPATVKAKVEGICKKAESGDLAAAQAAAKGVCSEVIDATIPAGPTREQALAACKAG